MSAAKPAQVAEARALQAKGVSQAQIAREIGVSRRRVRQVLVEGAPAADRMHELLLARAGVDDLHRHECVLVERVRRDLRHLRATREEIACRSVDELLGLTLPAPDASDSMTTCVRRRQQPRPEPVTSG